ncbi:neoverrucotoxin subunit alpha-like [Genypterus blacodes]|uniref:neoverrucotoxin subunit alpha-like n=1 Tax=Genypterus blacodes TaxID=154954 RepID=UPI003F76E298
MDHGGQQRIEAALRKSGTGPNTLHRNIKLSDNNRKVTKLTELQPYPEHPERFEFWCQLLCRNGLTGRCYWEVEWEGDIYISVSYTGISRKGDSDDCWLGRNTQSWSLRCSGYAGNSLWHNNEHPSIHVPVSSSVAHRIGVYVDCPAGILSFYSVSDKLIHLYTFTTTFTHPLYAGFGLWKLGSSVTLRDL